MTTKVIEKVNGKQSQGRQVDFSPGLPTLQKVHVRIQGVTPIMLNPMLSEDVVNMIFGIKKPKNAPKVPQGWTLRDIANKKMQQNTDEEGRFFLHPQMLMSALRQAGSWIRLDGKKQLSSGTSTLVPAFVTILDQRLYLDSPGWEVDVNYGTNMNAGKGVGVGLVRPRFDKWAFDVNITTDMSEMSEHQYRQLFDYAGNRVGLGAFRLKNGGVYGRFNVSCWENVALSS